MKYTKLIASLVLAFSLLAGCGVNKTDDTVLKVGASPAPHAQILEVVKPILAEKGITLEIVEFTDYVLPNKSLADGGIDANYFQHEPFLKEFNEKNKTDLISAASIHYEPLGIYAGKSSDFENIKDGAKIAVPNDTTNEARALLLLEANGIIKVKKGAGLEATVKDIEENLKNMEIVELEAAQIPRMLNDVDFGVINGNYALDAGVTDSIVKIRGQEVKEGEKSQGAETFGNIVAIRAEDKDKEKIKALVDALKSDEVKAFIEKEYNGIVVPLF